MVIQSFFLLLSPFWKTEKEKKREKVFSPVLQKTLLRTSVEKRRTCIQEIRVNEREKERERDAACIFMSTILTPFLKLPLFPSLPLPFSLSSLLFRMNSLMLCLTFDRFQLITHCSNRYWPFLSTILSQMLAALSCLVAALLNNWEKEQKKVFWFLLRLYRMPLLTALSLSRLLSRSTHSLSHTPTHTHTHTHIHTLPLSFLLQISFRHINKQIPTFFALNRKRVQMNEKPKISWASI